MALSTISKRRLQGVNPALVAIVERLAERNASFIVVEGVRTKARQQELVKLGKSWTLDSYHLTGHAVDLAPIAGDGTIPWNRWDLFAALAKEVKAIAKELGQPIEWGGDWRKKDGPHFQIPRE